MGSAIELQLLSNFDANPVTPALLRALSSVGAEARVGITPPAEISRYMVAPGRDTEHISGTLALIRVEDWLRTGLLSGKSGDAWAREELKNKVKEFASELSILAHRGKPVWFVCCPSTGWLSDRYKLASLCRTYTNLLSARVGNVSQITTLAWPASLSANFEDRAADEKHNVPFTQNAFETIGEVVGSELRRMLSAESGPVATSAGSSPELAAYLAGLQVQITLAAAAAADQPHVDHIIRSAASFSLTGEQPNITDGEVASVIASGRCVLVSVSDRLADHGPSGVIVYRETEGALAIDWMSLTCPVLGKQVEFALVPELAQMAKDRSLERILFEYRPSARNQPIRSFLESVADRDSGSRFVLAAADAEARASTKAVNAGAWSLHASGLRREARSGS